MSNPHTPLTYLSQLLAKRCACARYPRLPPQVLVFYWSLAMLKAALLCNCMPAQHSSDVLSLRC